MDELAVLGAIGAIRDIFWYKQVYESTSWPVNAMVQSCKAVSIPSLKNLEWSRARRVRHSRFALLTMFAALV